jgi:hypothetical protein
MLGSNIDTLTRLRGGVNNNVFVCGSGQRKWVVKEFPPQEIGKQDRMNAEVDFLRFSAQVAKGFAPILIEVDKPRRCIVIEYIEGSLYPEGTSPEKNDLRMAVCFFNKLNSNAELAKKMIHVNAAEGFLSLRQHMLNVRERLDAMGIEHLPNQYKPQAGRLLKTLYLRAEDVEICLEKSISRGFIEDFINPSDRCVSPGDFGFHNAICTSEGVRFFDFEFAGWDDPAKTCVDFVLQQRNPTTLKPIVIATEFLGNNHMLIKGRIFMMHKILKLKWECIILGILNPLRLVRMVSVDNEATEETCVADQMIRYQAYVRRTR